MWNECPSKREVLQPTDGTITTSSPWFNENSMTIREMAEEVCIFSGYYNHVFGNESKKTFYEYMRK
jgi:hypothetical protein